MSLSSIGSAATSVFPTVNFQSHHKGPKAGTAGAPEIGQLPVGAGSHLLGGLVKTLEQTVAPPGGAAALSAVEGAISAGAGLVAQGAGDLQSLIHSLLQSVTPGGGAKTAPLQQYANTVVQARQSGDNGAPALIGAHLNARV
jgi:hypothetical protein